MADLSLAMKITSDTSSLAAGARQGEKAVDDLKGATKGLGAVADAAAESTNRLSSAARAAAKAQAEAANMFQSRLPRSNCVAALSITARAPSSSIRQFASLCWMAWKRPIGWPN